MPHPTPPRALPARRRRGALPLLAAVALAAAACGDEPPPLSSAQEAQLAPFMNAAPPAGMVETDVDFDGKVRLLGYVVSPRQAVYNPGARVTVLLYWRCDQRVENGYDLLTHLVSETGELIQNIDDHGPLRKMEGFEGQPLAPSRWKPGKTYLDQLTFIVPGEPSPTLVVAAGIAKGDQRLPIRGAGGDKENRTSMIRLRTGMKNARAIMKRLSVPRLAPDAAIAIDGVLDEPAWASAAHTSAFVDVGTGRENRAIPAQGRARALWDDAFFYVAFEVADRNVTGGWPVGAKDPHLWEKDTVEIMIDPDGDGDNKDYYEIQINPQNLVFDSQFDDYNAPRGGPDGPFGHEEWSAGLTSAIKIDGTIDDDKDKDRGYTVEAKIPWASFSKAKRAPPAPGDTWRMNFYAMQNNGGSGWSPLFGEGNFHRARRFGFVRFVAAPGNAAPDTSASAGPSASAPPGAPPSAPAPASAKAPPAPSTKAPPAGPPVRAGDPDR
ncbi:MAG: carbohydrate-binding family 9-like protein [Polyangiaceae bacterium]|nr:carbohydrate-binding family 9-like protein [Polyangiaceae bacterium]